MVLGMESHLRLLAALGQNMGQLMCVLDKATCFVHVFALGQLGSALGQPWFSVSQLRSAWVS